MRLSRIPYRFKALPWRYNGPNGWYFISMPAEMSKEVREHYKEQEQGWGRLTAGASIDGNEWETAIWFDSKLQCYLLPLKSEIRKKIKFEPDKELDVVVYL